jgi:hypothetical protein
MTCELILGTARFPGIVRDVSPAGLFVQTRGRPAPNTVLQVNFPDHDQRPAITIRARVARHREVPRLLQSSVSAGVGLEILEAPPAFTDLLAEELAQVPAEPGPARPAPGDAPPPVRTFRVRLTEPGKPRSRIVTVHAQNKQGARARALARAGRGWKIADVDEA